MLLLQVGEPRLCTPSGFLCGMCEQLDVFDTRVTAKKLCAEQCAVRPSCVDLSASQAGEQQLARSDSQTRAPSASTPECI